MTEHFIYPVVTIIVAAVFVFLGFGALFSSNVDQAMVFFGLGFLIIK